VAGPRTHQIGNYEIALQVEGGKKLRRVVNHITTGGGKSALPPIWAVTLIPRIADRICWIVPRDSLRAQAVEAFNAQWLREWLGGMRQVRAAGNDVDPSRGTHGYVTTYQAVVQSPDLHRQEFERFRYILVLDEWHHVEEGSLWHLSLQPLVERAELVVMMSGTLERGDGKRMAFLEYRPTVQNGRTGETPDLDGVVIYSRAEALAERAILPITFKHFDLGGSWVDRKGDRITIESFDQVRDGQSGDALYTGLETQYAYELLRDCARDWRAYSSYHPSSRLLVVAHRQRAAKAYAAELKDKYGIRAVVAVSDDGEAAQEAIRRFRRGHHDALVTVGMAYEGLDVPGITHLACLTHIRSKPWIEQMFGRLVRVDPEAGPWQQQPAYAYVPDDTVMREVIERIKAEQEPFIRDRQREGGTGGIPDPGGIVALGGGISGLRLSELDGEEMSKDEAAFYQHVLDTNHLTGRLTPLEMRRAVQFASELTTVGGPMPRSVTQATVNDEEEKLRKDIQTACSRIDAARQRDFGTTNKEVLSVFGKSREHMTVPELQTVWAFLNSRYPSFM
jgi:superfamily II DNA or RNA helicase